MPLPDDPQERILRAYTVLRLLRPDWGGALIVCCGVGSQGAALLMAANIAGAVCLGIDDHPATLRELTRSGSCDFVVNSLDEALRIMKNELRKHQPISVGLQANPFTMLPELLERGVQPELFTAFASSLGEPASASPVADPESIELLRQRGATLVNFDVSLPIEGAIDARTHLHTFVLAQHWDLHTFNAADAAALKRLDARALALLPESDALRRQWLRGASHIVQRQRPLHRVLWLTPDEHLTLQADFPPTA